VEAAMPISLSCPCGRAIRARDDLAGRMVKCPQCGAVLTVPNPHPEPAPAPLPALNEEGLLPLDDPPPKKAPPRHDDDVIGEVLPAELDELDEVDDDDDERSMRERVRRKDDRAAEREAERERKKRKKRMRRAYTRALEDEGERLYDRPGRGASGGNWFGSIHAGVGGGIAMLVIGLICTGVGLKFGFLFFIGPILVIIGFVAIIKGIVDNNM
jgi:hypothetical protein